MPDDITFSIGEHVAVTPDEQSALTVHGEPVHRGVADDQFVSHELQADILAALVKAAGHNARRHADLHVALRQCSSFLNDGQIMHVLRRLKSERKISGWIPLMTGDARHYDEPCNAQRRAAYLAFGRVPRGR